MITREQRFKQDHKAFDIFCWKQLSSYSVTRLRLIEDIETVYRTANSVRQMKKDLERIDVRVYRLDRNIDRLKMILKTPIEL